jgi:hypothetical protein
VVLAGVLDPYTAFAGSVGPAAPEGTYTYKLTKGDQIHEGTVDVVADSCRRTRRRSQLRTTVDALTTRKIFPLSAAAHDPRRWHLGLKSDLRRRPSLCCRGRPWPENAPDEEIQASWDPAPAEEMVRLYAAVAMCLPSRREPAPAALIC